MAAMWRYLPGYQAPVLVRGDFGPSNYSIWLTDLTNVWTESLDRKPIIKRAFEIDSSVDPSEDSSQMRLLLSSIQKILHSEQGTQTSISSGINSDSLTMTLITSLSSSVPDLQWKCMLVKCPQSVLTQKIVVPLLASRVNAQVERKSLLSQLREKDKLIGKLINQMQVDGSNFSKVFPGSVSSKISGKSNVRQVLGRSIKGIGEFDEVAWEAQVREETPAPTRTETVLATLDSVHFDKSWDIFTSPDIENWWEKSKEESIPNRTKLNTVNKDVSVSQESNNVVEPTKRLHDHDFQVNTAVSYFRLLFLLMALQRQSTPPRKTKLSPKPDILTPITQSNITHDDSGDSTTDDSDDNTSSDRSRRLSPKPLNDQQHMKENFETSKVIGDGNPASHSPGTRRQGVSKSKSPSESLPVIGDAGLRVKPRLGKIGGKKKAAPEVSPEQDISTPNLEKSSAVDSANHGSKGAGALSPPSTEVGRGRKVSPPKETARREETSQERADKNREKLKRELEKGQTGKQKKRKF